MVFWLYTYLRGTSSLAPRRPRLLRSPRGLSQVRRLSQSPVVNVVLGFQHAYFQTHNCLCPLDESSAPISSSGASGGFSSAACVAPVLVASFAEHLTRCCSRAASLALLASPIPLALSSSLFGHLVALLLVSASHGFVAAGFLRSVHGIRCCACRFSSAPLQVNWQFGASCHCRTLRLGVERITRQFVKHSLLHLADSGCHLIVLNLRTPSSSPHKCSAVFSVLPNQTSSNEFASNLPRSSLVLGTRPSARTWYLQ